MTVHSEDFPVPNRQDSLERGSWLIPRCWHHCDENNVPFRPGADGDEKNGRSAKVPKRVRAIQSREVEWVKAWIQ